MNFNKQFATNNDCYKRNVSELSKPAYNRDWRYQEYYDGPIGVMVHSTGVNNPWLCRYVGPDDGKLGQNQYNNHWNMPGTGAMVHAFIGKLDNGSVATYQVMPWNYRAWHCGADANNNYISFEICEDNLYNDEYFNAVYEEAAQLTAMLCKEYGFDPMKDGVVICHQEGARRGIASNHSDVEHWFSKHDKTMDDFRHRVKAIMAPPKPAPKPIAGFTDVFEGSYYADAVKWAVEKGITTGVGDKKFEPNDECTRAQAVTFLWRAAGSPNVIFENPFVDVKESDYFFKAVMWAAKNGITTGTDSTHFSPNEVCTRAQAMTFLWRAAGSKLPSVDNKFTDVKSSDYFFTPVMWGYSSGVCSGVDSTHFDPNSKCTRSQMVTFLYRYYG